MATANNTTRRRKPKPSSFQNLRLKVGLSQAAAADLCGVTVRTIRNWDVKGAPLMAMRLLHMYDRKSCSGIGPDWSGFMFSRGFLVNKRLGLRFSPRGLERIPYLHEVFSRLEMARLRHQDGAGLDVVWAIVQGASASPVTLVTPVQVKAVTYQPQPGEACHG